MKGQCSNYYPSMYVEPLLAANRNQWHLNYKHNELIKILGKSVFIDTNCTVPEFQELYKKIFIENNADAVRIYIAAYPNNSNDPLVPSGYEGTVTVFYAPCYKSTDQDNEVIFIERAQKLRYLLHPYKGLILIDAADAKEWIDDYRNSSKILASLTSIVHQHGGDINLSDTKSILHEKKEIDEFLHEIECQNTFHIRAKFSSYANNETTATGQKYLCRLVLVYELIDTNGRVINIANPGRQHQSKTDEKGKKLDDFNNGSLCPPDKCKEGDF